MLYLRQDDKRWSTNKIGKTSLTLGRWGCTITCVSMLSSYYGCYKSPAELAAIPSLFSVEGKIIWSSIGKIFDNKMKFDIRRYGMNRAAITSSLNTSPRTSVIAEVSNGSHWVVIVGTYGTDYLCVDPRDGQKKLVLKTYKNITGSAHFTV